VALCTDDHLAQDAVIEAIGQRQCGLSGHAWFETFSVLTRLPPPQRRSAAEVLVMLHQNFPATYFPTDVQQRDFAVQLGATSIVGGAIYDGLVAMAARASGHPLLSRDKRAATTYAQVGIALELLTGQ
jgi:toxin FitB